jgi:hypothetical protein
VAPPSQGSAGLEIHELDTFASPTRHTSTPTVFFSPMGGWGFGMGARTAPAPDSSGSDGAPLDVEADIEYVAVLDDVVLPLEPLPASLHDLGAGACLN